MKSDVLVILTCYSRPHNMPHVIDAWNRQTVNCNVIAVDNRPKPDTVDRAQIDREGTGHSLEDYPDYNLLGVSDVWRWTDNCGCPCWLAPAAMLSHKYKYIVRADDDFLPGTKAVEWMLRTASRVNDLFAAIGEAGRTLNDGKYKYGDSPRDSKIPLRVDNAVRGCMVLASSIPVILTWRNFLAGFEPKSAHLLDVHDDLLTSTALQCEIGGERGYPTYVTPISDDREHLLINTEMPSSGGVHQKPNWVAERQAFIDLAVRNGWRSLV